MAEFNMKQIGKAMKATRELRGKTKEELAIETGLAVSSIYNYETGKNVPGLYNLIHLADALRVPLDVYIGRKVKYE